MEEMEHILKWCLERGERGGEEHTGLKKIKPNEVESDNQLKKALSDLEVMEYLYKGNKTDWVASAAFYAMYHSLLAILYKLGYESRNQECTIALVENLVNKKIIKLDEEYIGIIKNIQNKEGARDIREEMQYGSKTAMDAKRCSAFMEQAKKFVEKIKEVLIGLNKTSENIGGNTK